jgi:hypothetical protein
MIPLGTVDTLVVRLAAAGFRPSNSSFPKSSAWRPAPPHAGGCTYPPGEAAPINAAAAYPPTRGTVPAGVVGTVEDVDGAVAEGPIGRCAEDIVGEAGDARPEVDAVVAGAEGGVVVWGGRSRAAHDFGTDLMAGGGDVGVNVAGGGDDCASTAATEVAVVVAEEAATGAVADACGFFSSSTTVPPLTSASLATVGSSGHTAASSFPE